jgi:hypothetical protein
VRGNINKIFETQNDSNITIFDAEIRSSAMAQSMGWGRK